jgi:predicted DNA repair protein MutK
VKIDDFGLYLSRKSGGGARALGRGILRAAPWLMKGLSIAGTAAMFLVGGGILVHGIPPLGHAIEQLGESLPGAMGAVAALVLDGLAGIVAGALVLGAVTLVQRMRGRMVSG